MYHPQKWKIQTRGTISKLVIACRKFPRNLLINRGNFTWLGSKIEFAGVDAVMGKSSATEIFATVNWKKQLLISARSGESILYSEDLDPLVLSNNDFAGILTRFRPVSGKLAFDEMTVSGPISGKSQLDWSFFANIQNITLNSKGLPGLLNVEKGQIKWGKKRLEFIDIHAAMGKSQISRFSGIIDMNRPASFELSCETASLFAGEIYPFMTSFQEFQPGIKFLSTIKGMLLLSDVGLKGPVNRPSKWHYAMSASMQNIDVHSKALGEPLTIMEGSVNVSTEISDNAIHRKIDLKSTNLRWGKNSLTIAGEIRSTKYDLLLEMNLNADVLAWNQIDVLFKHISKQKAQSKRPRRKTNLMGTFHVKSNSLLWDIYTVRPLEAEVRFTPQKVTVAVHRADICGISFRGLMNWSDQMLDLYFVPTASNYELAAMLTCLTAQRDLATGTYHLNGEILAKAKLEAITRSLTGQLAFSATDGRIYRFGLLAKLLAILNVTEIYRGEIPDLIGDGFAYRTMTANAKLQGGKIIMQECAIDGVAMGIACEGEIDLTDQQMDLIILVAPFKTVDRIVEILPLIGNVLGGKLISIPFKAKGDLNDPTVYALPPTAVGSGILGILERTLKLPITIIQPVISGVKNSKPTHPAVSKDSPR
jgi:hypothetical protein